MGLSWDNIVMRNRKGKYTNSKFRAVAGVPRTSVRKVNSKINAVIKHIKKTQEVKYNDIYHVGDVVNYSGTVYRLNDMAQGDDEGQHIGNKINGKYLSIRGFWQGNSNEQFNVCRFILFVDTEQTGTDPTVADILQVSGAAAVTVAPINVDHTPRYKILYDKTTILSAQTGTFARPFKIFKKLKDLTMAYTGTTTNTQYKNAIYALAVTDVTVNDPGLTFYSRLAYLDS